MLPFFFLSRVDIVLILQFHSCARCARPWGCSDEHVYNLREGRGGEKGGSVGTKVK